ncbi:MAG: aromatic-ring-hydroxylating dioxygenase subunit beta [Betaproteobacteria bacterium]|nr:aromatic-ring-hydroxylating dioxygenase subunit beta [Betaproteobacteria bacterium]
MPEDRVRQALGTGVVIEPVQSLTGAESIAPDHQGRGRESAAGYLPGSVEVDRGLLRDVEVLLTRQALMLDARRWLAWIDLFTDDGVYWMPAMPEQTDWASEPSIFAEDRDLMEIRANRLLHPNAWSQAAPWATHHLLGITLVEHAEGDRLATYTPFQMMELRRDRIRHFGGSYRHVLHRQDGGWKIRLQRVDLFNAQASYDYVIQAWV